MPRVGSDLTIEPSLDEEDYICEESEHEYDEDFDDEDVDRYLNGRSKY